MNGRHSSTLLQIIPALVALGLGCIYAFGAISVLGQFESADLDALQTLPLVPIDQILARGIGSITQVAILSLPVALFGAVGVFRWDEEAASRARSKSKDSAPEGQTRTMPNRLLLLLMLLIVGALLFVPSDFLTILVFGLASMGVAIRVVRKRLLAEGRLWRTQAFVAGYTAFVLVATASGSLVRSAPLPEASLRLERGGMLNGGLVASTGSTWYLAREDGEVLGVPTENVVRSEITYLDPETDSSLFEDLLD